MQALLIADGRIASGGSPLLMHNERLVDPLDEFVRAIRLISKKRNKSDADHLEVGRLEFLAGLYTSPPIEGPGDLNGQVPSIPAWNIIRCLQDGATRQKRGKDVLSGVYPLKEFAELEYTGPSAPEALWKQPAFRLRKTVGVSRSRVMRTRPVFTEWQARLPNDHTGMARRGHLQGTRGYAPRLWPLQGHDRAHQEGADMSAQTRFESVLDRIASATSIIRSRSEEAARLTTHGGELRDLNTKLEDVVDDLERLALDLRGRFH